MGERDRPESEVRLVPGVSEAEDAALQHAASALRAWLRLQELLPPMNTGEAAVLDVLWDVEAVLGSPMRNLSQTLDVLGMARLHEQIATFAEVRTGPSESSERSESSEPRRWRGPRRRRGRLEK